MFVFQCTDIYLRILNAFLNLFIIDFETLCYGISDKSAVLNIFLSVFGNYFSSHSSVLMWKIIYKFIEVFSDKPSLFTSH